MVAEAPEAARGTTVEQDDTPTPTVAGAERDTADLQSGMVAEAPEAARGTTVEQDDTPTPTVAGAERDTADLQSGMVAEAPEAASGDGEAEQQSEYGYNRARYEAEAAAELVMDSLGTNLSGLASMLTQTMRQDDKSPSRTAADKGGTPTPEPGKAEEIESTQVVQDALKKLKETATPFLHTSSKATSERDGTQAVGTTVEQDDTPTPTVAGVAEGSRSTPTTAQPAEAIQKPTGATKQAKSGGMAGAPLQQTRSASSQPAAEQTQKEEFSAEIEGAAQELSDAINRAKSAGRNGATSQQTRKPPEPTKYLPRGW